MKSKFLFLVVLFLLSFGNISIQSAAQSDTQNPTKYQYNPSRYSGSSETMNKFGKYLIEELKEQELFDSKKGLPLDVISTRFLSDDKQTTKICFAILVRDLKNDEGYLCKSVSYSIEVAENVRIIDNLEKGATPLDNQDLKNIANSLAHDLKSGNFHNNCEKDEQGKMKEVEPCKP